MTLLDDFQRANENPLSDGGNWGALYSGAQCILDANSATGTIGVNTRSAWVAETFGPDIVVEAGVDLPNSISGSSMGLFARVTDVGTANFDGYYFQIIESGFGTWSANLIEFTNGADTTIAGPVAVSGDTDMMRLSCVGGQIEGYTHNASGWTRKFSVTDTAHTTAGNVGIGGFSTTWNFQSFSVESVPTGSEIIVQTGFFAAPGATGSQTISGLCFEPKAVLFRYAEGTSLGYGGTNEFMSLGFADADLNQYAVGTRCDTGVNPNGFWAFTYPYIGNCIQIGVGGASLTGMTADGFTLNWGTSATGMIEFVAFGGESCQAKVKLINPTTGSQSFTGYGFQGQLLMWLHARGSTWNTEDFVRMNIDWGFGSGSATSEQFCCHQIANAGANPSQTASQFNDGFIDNWGGTSLTSFDADGYTVNTAGNYGGVNIVTLLLGNSAETGSFKVVNGTQKTSTGTQAYTGAGFQPGAVIVSGVCDTDMTGNLEAEAFNTFGAYDSVDHACVWGGAKNGVGTSLTAVRHAEVLISHSTPASTTNAEAVVDSFDADGMTLDWTTADSTARVFGIVYFDCIPGNPCGFPARLSFDGTILE